MSATNSTFPIPRDSDAFESIVLRILQNEYNNPHLTKYGRSGQKQNGIDIIGENKQNGENVGIQVKLRQPKTPLADIKLDLDNDIKLAEKLNIHIDRLVIITTRWSDVDLQSWIQQKSESYRASGLFTISLHENDWYQERLRDYPHIARRFSLVPDLSTIPYPGYRSNATVSRSDAMEQHNAPNAPYIYSPTEHEIGRRVYDVIDRINEERVSFDKITIPSLCRSLGIDDWREIELIATGYGGQTETYFAALARRLGISARWLIEGKGQPFRFNEDVNGESLIPEGYQEIYEYACTSGARRLHFARSADTSWNDVVVCLEFDNLRWEVFNTVFPIRRNVGAGGTMEIVKFWGLAKRLSIKQQNLFTPWPVHSEVFRRLRDGEAHPSNAFFRKYSDMDFWIDDFVDLRSDDLDNNVGYYEDLMSAIDTAKTEIARYEAESDTLGVRRQFLSWARGND